MSILSVDPLHFAGLGPHPNVALRCGLALVAVGGLITDGGYSTSKGAEATMMREIMNSGDRVAVLVDSTKFGRKLFARFAPLSIADYVVTERLPQPEYREALADAGVELIGPETMDVHS